MQNNSVPISWRQTSLSTLWTKVNENWRQTASNQVFAQRPWWSSQRFPGEIQLRKVVPIFSSSHQILFPAWEKGSCTYIHEHMDVGKRRRQLHQVNVKSASSTAEQETVLLIKTWKNEALTFTPSKFCPITSFWKQFHFPVRLWLSFPLILFHPLPSLFVFISFPKSVALHPFW